MSSPKKEFEFILQEDLQYADGTGGFAKAKKMLLRAPSTKQKKYSIKLRQGFMQAVKSNVDTFSKSKNTAKTSSSHEEMKGEEILGLMLMSDVDMVGFCDTFKDLLIDGCCLVDGKIVLTLSLYEGLSDEETSRLMGEYIANFLIPSLMKQQKES